MDDTFLREPIFGIALLIFDGHLVKENQVSCCVSPLKMRIVISLAFVDRIDKHSTVCLTGQLAFRFGSS
jgi:hypothetical protein